jgi:Cytochrome c oxidase subunit III
MLNLNRSNFQAHPFHLVSPSPWPLYTSISLLSLTTSAVLSFHGFAYAGNNLILSLTSLVLSMSFWFRDIIAEGTSTVFKRLFLCAGVAHNANKTTAKSCSFSKNLTINIYNNTQVNIIIFIYISIICVLLLLSNGY